MRKPMWILPAVILFAAMGLPATVSANVYTYNFNLQDGGIGVTGTAVLTNALGAVDFQTCNCVGDIFISDPSQGFTASLYVFTGDVQTAGGLQSGPSAWDVTPTSISFDFDAPASTTEFLSLVPGDDTSLAFVSDGEIIATNSTGATVSTSISGTMEIAAAPEPSSLTLMLSGLLGLALLVGFTRGRANHLEPLA